MPNTYRAVSEYGKAVYPEGVFDHEFTAVEERDALDGGHLELVPREYRALTNHLTLAEQGKTFKAGLPVEQEAALIQGGHIERVDKPATTTRKG